MSLFLTCLGVSMTTFTELGALLVGWTERQSWVESSGIFCFPYCWHFWTFIHPVEVDPFFFGYLYNWFLYIPRCFFFNFFPFSARTFQRRTFECRARRSASLSMLIVFPTWPRHVILVVVWSGGPVFPSRSGLLLDMAGEKTAVSPKSSCNLQLKVETDHFG